MSSTQTRRSLNPVIREAGSNALEINRGSDHPMIGWLAVGVAVSLLLGGIFIDYIPFVEDKVGWRMVLLVAFLIPLLLGVTQLVRSGVRINRRTGTITEWTRLWGYRRERAHAFDDISNVTVDRFTLHSSNSGTRVLYSVTLKGPEPHVLLLNEDKYSPARTAGESIAEFIGKPLRDEAAEPVYREDGTAVDTRAPEALHGAPAVGAKPDSKSLKMPHGCRIRMRQEQGRIVFEMPQIRRTILGALLVSALAIGAAAGIGAAVTHYMEPGDPLAVRVFIWCLPGALAVGVPAIAIWNGVNRCRQDETVTVTPLALSRRVRRVLTNHQVDVPIDTIEEFGYTPQAAAWAKRMETRSRRRGPLRYPAVLVRSDFQQVRLGQNLMREEQVWLHNALRYLLWQAKAGG